MGMFISFVSIWDYVYCNKLCLGSLGFCIANAQLYKTLKSNLERLAALGGNDANFGVKMRGKFG